MRHPTLLILLIGLFSSCTSYQFENKFYDKLEDGIKQYKLTRQPVKFNLTDITDFEWDRMILIRGNESVPVLAEEIEKFIGQKTTDLGLNKDRFYFFNHNMLTKEIEISHDYNNQAFSIEACSEQSNFLTVQESNFKLIPNTLTVKTGTVYLYPTCKKIPEALLNSKKE